MMRAAVTANGKGAVGRVSPRPGREPRGPAREPGGRTSGRLAGVPRRAPTPGPREKGGYPDMAVPRIIDPRAAETLASRSELPIPPPPIRSGPDPEVPEKATRRRFTAEYKLRLLREADGCVEPGALGALLRREGLYSSHLTTWRRQRERGALEALTPKKRGRPASPAHPLVRRIAELERDTARLQERLRQAEVIIAAQKKLSEILGLPLPPPAAGDLA